MKMHGKKPSETERSTTPKAPRIERDNDLEHAELSGEEDRSPDTDASETDDDEREGSGDGNIGRSTRNR